MPIVRVGIEESYGPIAEANGDAAPDRTERHRPGRSSLVSTDHPSEPFLFLSEEVRSCSSLLKAGRRVSRNQSHE